MNSGPDPHQDVIILNPGTSRATMDTLYCKMLKVFRDGELHTYAEVWEKVLKDLYPLGWNKGSFLSLEKNRYIKFIDRKGPNRSFRYKITKDGLNVLDLAEVNQRVFFFLRHFKDKNKDDYYAAILKKQLESESTVADDLTPEGFLKAVEALCSDGNELGRKFGNYSVYSERIWNLIKKTDVLDEIIADPVVSKTILDRALSSESYVERARFFDFWNKLKEELSWKKKIKEQRDAEQRAADK